MAIGGKIFSYKNFSNSLINFFFKILVGPGARIYAVPESTDLEELALTHKGRSLDNIGVLVARGPAIFYNKET